MLVTINNSTYDYESDFSTKSPNWKVKLKDAFRTAAIGNTICFIKRFGDIPNAKELLIELKNKPVINMPRIFDLVTVTENNKTVYYLFTEFIEGKTLKEVIKDNEVFNTKKIFDNILESLKFIHNNGFWYSDLNEENIYCDTNGKYLLIDVDSCWSTNLKPCADPKLNGGMPGAAQRYASVAMQFYREILNKPAFLYEHIKGENLNNIQILAIIAKLEMFCEYKKSDPSSVYFNENKYKNLHNYLLNKNEVYCKDIFSRALNDDLKSEMVKVFSKFVTGDYEAPVTDLPVIEHFTATQLEILEYENTTILWKVSNADVISLSSTTQILLHNAKSTSSYKASLTATETYTITATKKDKKVTSSLQVNVSHPLKPKIEKEENVKVKNTSIIKMKSSASWRIAAAIIFFTVLFLALWQNNISSKYDNKINAAESASSYGNYDEALTLFDEALVIKRTLFLFTKDALYSKIHATKASKYKKEGDDLLDKGNIVLREGEFGGSALNSYKLAISYSDNNDESLNSKIRFCEMIGEAQAFAKNENWDDAKRAYANAINFGSLNNISKVCLDGISKRLDSFLPKVNFINITKVDDRYKNEVYDNGTTTTQLGIQISLNFETENLYDTLSSYIVVLFYDSSGNGILNDFAPYYWDGQLATYGRLSSTIKIANYNWSCFLPFKIKHWDTLPATSYGFKCAVFSKGKQISDFTSMQYFKY